MNTTTDTTDEHRTLVQRVFDEAAPHYDLMNDLMTLGLHRPVKAWMVDMASVQPHHQVLDLAAGTCDLAALAAPAVSDGRVFALDSNAAMLSLGRDRLLDQGLNEVQIVCAAAEQLPFVDLALDRILVGFGLRNFSQRELALSEMYRCLKPGGRLLCLETSKPSSRRLGQLHDWLSERILPTLGNAVAGDGAPWQYLHDSTRRFPDPAEIIDEMREAGFTECRRHRILGGVLCLYLAEKA